MKPQQQFTVPERLLIDLHWMARRYCDGRASTAASRFNDIVRQLVALGVPLEPGVDQTIWARDAWGPQYCGLTDEEYALGRPLI